MSPDTVVTKPISLEPSRPALPFAEISTELRFAVLKCVFPRGSVVANSFIVTADELALCVMHNGSWSLTTGSERSRNGCDLLALFKAYFGASSGDAAVRLLEAAAGITLSARQGDAIARTIDELVTI